MHSPRLPVSVDAGELFRQFLPSKSLTVHAKGIQIRYRNYWHPMLAARIGQRVEISWDERTIQHIYANLDGRHVKSEAGGVGKESDNTIRTRESPYNKKKKKKNKNN